MIQRCHIILRFFVFSIFSHVAIAQVPDIDFSKIDRWAKTQKLQDTSLADFTYELIKPASNDYEKIRAIYVFVIHFLDYDRTAEALDKRRINQDIADILQRKKGICLDYAQLLCKMAKLAQMECYVVTGFSKDLRNPHKISVEPDHAWNVVRVDSNYFVLDPTWGSNTIYSKDLFQETFGEDYFLTDPTLFIKNHFPNLDMWQLLSCPVDFRKFSESGRDSTNNETCFINYRDSILAFQRLSVLDQKIKEQSSVYHYLPNSLNQSAWAHALLDKAIFIKESADQNYQENNLGLARAEYENAINLFEIAGTSTKLYRWQTEARGFCHLNYAQVIYRLGTDKMNVARVIDQMKKARLHLLELETSSIMVNQALAQIEKTLEQLK